MNIAWLSLKTSISCTGRADKSALRFRAGMRTADKPVFLNRGIDE